MRAREPDHQGHLEHEGVKLGYEVFGDGDPTILLLPTWTIIHSRFWKLQVPVLARHHRVVTYDGPGNGRADQPLDAGAYDHDRQVAHALAVLDATDTPQAVVVGLSRAANWALDLAANHAERVLGTVYIAASLDLAPSPSAREEAYARFTATPPPMPPSAAPFATDPDDHWHKCNATWWRERWADWSAFFFGQCFTEPHSTKQIEDCIGWAAETTPEVLLAEVAGSNNPPRETLLDWCARVASPTLVIHGTDDRVSPMARAEILAEATRGDLLALEGAGHIPLARDPVRVNLAIRAFTERLSPRRPHIIRWTRGRARRKGVLYVSSPIGLGHARRDLATVQALRRHHPDLQVDWLAQHPVTRVLQDAGEAVHPASAHLVSESAHIEDESAEHDLHAFQAIRRMDEILLANFMVFHEVVGSRDYDLVVGDEAWEVDYFLHENPELKRFAYAWATDFVGWLPMPDGGDHEARLTADYNAEMIEHIARHPRVRDVAWFVGNPDDIVPDAFGPDLPGIREWTERHYSFSGYVTGFDPRALGDRDEVRERLGYHPDEQVCIVTVGGSGVGGSLLQAVIAAFGAAKRRVPALRMVVVAGPRIDPDSLPAHDGLEVRGYVPALHEHLTVCDLAIVQSGLTTCMELTAGRTPFVYVPLRHHFEQHFHVHHRLQGHRAGRRLDYHDATPDHLAEVIAAEIGRSVDYAPVEADGAERAAALLAQLL